MLKAKRGPLVKMAMKFALLGNNMQLRFLPQYDMILVFRDERKLILGGKIYSEP